MSDAFYKLICAVGRPVFWLSSSPTILHADRVPRQGAFILAPNHLSPYDVPCLMAATPRMLDFVSIVEVFANPLVGWFYGRMNAFPLDRNRADPKTVRIILNRLNNGRAVAMFPEGRIRSPEQTVLRGASFNQSILRLAAMAGVPIVPCAILGTGNYSRPAAWMPLRRTRYAVGFGQPIMVEPGDGPGALADAWPTLYAELKEATQREWL